MFVRKQYVTCICELRVQLSQVVISDIYSKVLIQNGSLSVSMLGVNATVNHSADTVQLD